jgi:hemin uptake protein HemP
LGTSGGVLAGVVLMAAQPRVGSKQLFGPSGRIGGSC